MKPAFDEVLRDYVRYRTGYPTELYERILAELPARPLDVLDLACGTGLGSEGLAPRARRLVGVDLAPGMLRAAELPHRVLGAAERLPLRDGAFDLVACAQAFHWMEPQATYRELHRVLRSPGLAALWWKYEAAADPTAKVSDAVIGRILGRPAPHTDMARQHALPLVEASPFGGAEEVWLHHRGTFTVESYLGYQASREVLRREAGPLRDAALAALREALQDLHGDRAFEVAYLDRLCLLRKA